MTLTTCLILLATLICFGKTQSQPKDVVTGFVKDTVRNTKIQLGFGVPVKGQAGYDPSERGENLTFVLSGMDLGFVDPFVQVGFTSTSSPGHKLIGNTESGRQPPMPEWSQAFWLVWNKSNGLKLSVTVLDHSAQDKVIGEGALDMDEFVANGPNATVTVSLGSTNDPQTIPVGKVIVKRTTPLKFKLAASNVQKSDEFGGLSDPYIKVYFRNGEQGQDTKFYTTKTIDNVVNAKWNEIVEFPQYRPKTGQYLHFKIRDADSYTRDDHLGEVLVEADSIYYDSRPEQTVFLENSGEHSSITIMRV